MKLKNLLVIYFMFIAVFSASSQTRNVDVCILSFNIRYNNPHDSIYSWSARKQMVFKVIAENEPDIFCVQEALSDQMDELKLRFPEYSVEGVGRDDGKSAGEFSAIFYRTDRFERVDGSTFWLSETPDKPGSKSWKTACTRISTRIKLKDYKSGNMIHVFNTHLDHESIKAQVEGIKLIRKKIAETAGKDKVFVTGDFNSTHTDSAYKLMAEPKALIPFVDARSVAKKSKNLPDFTFGGFPFIGKKGQIIDHIFIRTDKDVSVFRFSVDQYNENGRFPSDHLPVCAVVRFKVLVNEKQGFNQDMILK